MKRIFSLITIILFCLMVSSVYAGDIIKTISVEFDYTQSNVGDIMFPEPIPRDAVIISTHVIAKPVFKVSPWEMVEYTILSQDESKNLYDYELPAISDFWDSTNDSYADDKEINADYFIEKETYFKVRVMRTDCVQGKATVSIKYFVPKSRDKIIQAIAYPIDWEKINNNNGEITFGKQIPKGAIIIRMDLIKSEYFDVSPSLLIPISLCDISYSVDFKLIHFQVFDTFNNAIFKKNQLTDELFNCSRMDYHVTRESIITKPFKKKTKLKVKFTEQLYNSSTYTYTDIPLEPLVQGKAILLVEYVIIK